MPATVVVGGQYGSEGKGKVAFVLAREGNARFAVRVGGPNSGHTVIDSTGHPRILRQVPTAALLGDVISIIPPGSVVDPEILLAEVTQLGLGPERLLVDPRATVVTREHQLTERMLGLGDAIGSTQSGTGAALVRRMERVSRKCLASELPRLRPFLEETAPILRATLQQGHRVLIEGTQGFGLSLLHSPSYPYVTSRDTTPAGFVAEAGLSPLDVDEVVMVIRSHPIRVGGNSGPLPYETTWDSVSLESGSSAPIAEYTSVTRVLRRVARFDPEIVRRALTVANPTSIVLNHVDYVDANCRDSHRLTEKAHSFVKEVERAIGRAVNFVGTGPATMIPSRGAKGATQTGTGNDSPIATGRLVSG